MVGLRKLGQLSLMSQDSLANRLRSDLFTSDEVIQRPDRNAEFAGRITRRMQEAFADCICFRFGSHADVSLR